MTIRLAAILILIVAGCGSDVERVQSVGAGKADYRKSPCACFKLKILTPGGEDARLRGLAIEHALG